jgi:hypothetical protein
MTYAYVLIPPFRQSYGVVVGAAICALSAFKTLFPPTALVTRHPCSPRVSWIGTGSDPDVPSTRAVNSALPLGLP